MGHVKHSGRDWAGGSFVHHDPEICRMYIQDKNRELDKKIDELKACNSR